MSSRLDRRRKKIIILALIAVIIAETGYVLYVIGPPVRIGGTIGTTDLTLAHLLERVVGKGLSQRMLNVPEREVVVVRFVMDDTYREPTDEFCNVTRALVAGNTTKFLVDVVVPSAAGRAYSAETLWMLFRGLNQSCGLHKPTAIVIPSSIGLLDYYDEVGFVVKRSKHVVANNITLMLIANGRHEREAVTLANESRVVIRGELTPYQLISYPILEIVTSYDHVDDIRMSLKVRYDNVTALVMSNTSITGDLLQIDDAKVYRTFFLPDVIRSIGQIPVNASKVTLEAELIVRGRGMMTIRSYVLKRLDLRNVLVAGDTESKSIVYVVTDERAANSTFVTKLIELLKRGQMRST